MREVIDEHRAIIAALAAQDSAAAAAAAQAHIPSFRSALLHDGNPAAHDITGNSYDDPVLPMGRR